MKIVQTSKNGINYLTATLKDKIKTFTQAILWKIPHNSGIEDLSLKLARYTKSKDEHLDVLYLESNTPKSELTLDNEELKNLLEFISQNYEPFRQGVKKYIPIDEKFDQKNINHLKGIFENPDKQRLLEFVMEHGILPEELIAGVQYQNRIKSVQEFQTMLNKELGENVWQAWFQKNDWVLGTEFIKILDERDVDTGHIADYLMKAYDGFLDIIEIKRPSDALKFWSPTLDHGNYIPSTDLTKSIIQATKYIHEVEREANSIKFLEKVDNTKVIKPRCILLFGRSSDWNSQQKESYRILNSSFHNLTILTYDHVLDRAKRILSIQ